MSNIDIIYLVKVEKEYQDIMCRDEKLIRLFPEVKYFLVSLFPVQGKEKE